ncbi:MAG: peroxide stress protein YaaA [Renibacterium sp.]|nr:peroxide stress protein YaaA [Renibacterium sp.]
MLILLPPSEGKTPAPQGRPLALDELSFPQLTAARDRVHSALAEVSAHPEALERLGVGASLAAEVARNLRLSDEPAAAAHSIYSGVLYDALGYHSMTPVQRRKADESILVMSGLWGAVGFADRIPAYRLSMSVALPGVGRLASYWKPLLSAALAERAAGELIIDCRSSTYATAWTPPAEQTVEVNVFQLRNGKRSVVSHFAKHTRGEVARLLLTRRGNPPKSPAELLRATQSAWQTELQPGSAKRPHSLNVILPEGVSFAAPKH